MNLQNNDAQRYFIYARKSSESEDRQMASIDSQIDELTKLAQENSLNVVQVFSESKSAKAPGREVFSDMMQRIKKGEADGIICWKLNRLARKAKKCW
jgi:DNA invertase Pin-like site-specific DNA recombinase